MAQTKQLSVLTIAEQIPDEASAYRFMESQRWPDGAICPHCGSGERVHFLNPENGVTRTTRTGSKSARRVWFCGACRKQFSVLTGTMMHGTKIPVRTWVFVIFEMVSSKNGVSAHEIERKYDLTPKSAWFMTMRVREAMNRGPLAEMLSGTVTADETFIGGKPKNMHANKRNQVAFRNARDNKTAVLSLVHRETGEVRSRVVPDVRRNTLKAAIEAQVDLPQTVLHTDSAKVYTQIGWKAADHQTVNHIMGEYVRGDVTTNHAEGYFSQLKRSLDGTHHHVSAVHLPRYLAEFDFRFSTRKLNDTARMARLMGQTGGRRLNYSGPSGL